MKVKISRIHRNIIKWLNQMPDSFQKTWLQNFVAKFHVAMTQNWKLMEAIHFHCFKGIIPVVEILVCGDDRIAEDTFQQFEPKLYTFTNFWQIKIVSLLCAIDNFIGHL